jgi:hypothetical protein
MCYANSARTWEAKRYGTILGSKENMHRLTYALFADDTTLVAKPRKAMKEMLGDFIAAMSTLGLTLNADKCSTQCSQTVAKPRPPLRVNDVSFKIVDRDEGFKFFGTIFTHGSTTK